MMEVRKLGEVRIIPLDWIDVDQSRERHRAALDNMVDHLESTRLKDPITVTPHEDRGDTERFQLLLGEENLRAYRFLGETHIPARVVRFRNDDELIMFLTESVSRERRTPLKTIAAFEAVRDIGFGPKEIAKATGLSESYVEDMLTLLHEFEEQFHIIDTGAVHDR